MLLWGVAVFTAASAVAAAAPSLGVLVGARAVQAVGAAMIVPTSLGLLYPSFPKEQHTLVVGLWAGVAAVAASAGPPVGGLLVSVDWRWIFLINLPIGVATIVAGARILPEVREHSGARLPDVTSIVSLLGATSLIVLGTSEGSQWGWGAARTIVVFAAGVLLGALAVQRTLRARTPVIEPKLFASRPFTAATIALFSYFIGFAIFLLGSALFMQQVWHFSALKAGLSLAPAPVASIAFAVSAGPIQRRLGRTIPAVTGTTIMAIAAASWLVLVGDQPAYWSAMFPGLVLMGVSGGLSQAPMFAAASTLDPDRATTGSAVLNMSRQVGSALGVALLVATTTAISGVAGYDRAWAIQLAAGLVAAASLLALRRDVS
jgi:MFS family permease